MLSEGSETGPAGGNTRNGRATGRLETVRTTSNGWRMIQYSYDVFSFDGDRWALERTYSTTQGNDAFQFARQL